VTNPYQAPGAPVADLDRPRGSPVKAVIYGVLVDVLGTTGATMILMFVYGIMLATRGASPEEIQGAATAIDPASALGVTATAIGCAFSFLGGYVCARVARHAELKWAAVTGAISAALGWLMTATMAPDALNIFLLALGFAIVVLGGYVGARRNAVRP
jgi:hypothetical protein